MRTTRMQLTIDQCHIGARALALRLRVRIRTHIVFASMILLKCPTRH
jgi:hypothetical protein